VRIRLFPAAALVATLACQPAENAPAPRTEAPKDAVLHQATLDTWRRNSHVVTARADTVTWYRQDARFVAAQVTAQLPSRDGPVEVTAPVVEGQVSGEVLDAHGGVRVVSARGVATGPSAHCENGPDGTIVSSDAGMVFTGPGQRLTARAFRFDANAQRARFEGVETSTEATQ
jgi:hypothetical protein